MIRQIKLKKEQMDSFQNDIYSGEENIQFINRHPIFKTLMKLEFEDILRSFSNNVFQDED